MERPTVFRIANERIAARARELGISGPVPLICECESHRCFELVRIPVDEYDARARSGPVTHPRHRRALVTAA
jgi:hypothetical protein